MTKPTRFPNGVTNAKLNSAFADMGIPDPSRFHAFFDDWDFFAPGRWTTTEVGSATQDLTDGDGGILLITNDVADDDSSFSQLDAETFLFEVGKKLAFKTRFKVSDATQSEFIIGLQIRDTAPMSVTDGVFFRKDDGDTNLDLVVEKNSTATTQVITTIADDTYLDVSFIYNGVDKIDYFLNDERVGQSVVTNLPDDEELTISFGIQNGEAASKTMSIDFINIVKER